MRILLKLSRTLGQPTFVFFAADSTSAGGGRPATSQAEQKEAVAQAARVRDKIHAIWNSRDNSQVCGLNRLGIMLFGSSNTQTGTK
jgi:hypothetical protein